MQTTYEQRRRTREASTVPMTTIRVDTAKADEAFDRLKKRLQDYVMPVREAPPFPGPTSSSFPDLKSFLRTAKPLKDACKLSETEALRIKQALPLSVLERIEFGLPLFKAPIRQLKTLQFVVFLDSGAYKVSTPNCIERDLTRNSEYITVLKDVDCLSTDMMRSFSVLDGEGHVFTHWPQTAALMYGDVLRLSYTLSASECR